MMSDKFIKTSHFAAAALFCVLLLIGTVYDRDISHALYTPLNVPFLILTTAGQYVYFASFVFFAGALCRQANVCGTITARKRNAYRIICAYLALSTGTIGSASVLHYECIGAFFPGVKFSFGFTLIFCLLFFYPLFFVGYHVGRKEYDNELVQKLIRLLIFLTVTASAIGLIKLFFFRPRYRTTLMGYDEISFVPWYSFRYASASDIYEIMQVHGLDRNAFRSFPSGHSVMSVSSIYIFPAFSLVFPKLKDREKILFIIGLIYGLSVMLSRIVLGAHHLSDVAVGALIADISSYLFCRLRNRYRS